MKIGLNSWWTPWAALINVLLLPTPQFCICKLELILCALLRERVFITVLEEARGRPRTGSRFCCIGAGIRAGLDRRAAAGCCPTSPRSGFVNIPINNTATGHTASTFLRRFSCRVGCFCSLTRTLNPIFPAPLSPAGRYYGIIVIPHCRGEWREGKRGRCAPHPFL